MSLAFALAAALAAPGASALADERLLTEAESLRLGLARPELAELARGRVGEAEADAVEADLWANPTLEISRDDPRGAGTREDSWRLSQAIDVSGRRALKREAGDRRIAAAAADARLLHQARAVEIRHGFHQLLLRSLQLAAIETWARRFADIERIVGKLRAAGEASGYDLRRLARERQAAEARRAEAKAELDRLRAQFAALIGPEFAAYTGVTGALLPDPPAALPALTEGLAERPDLAALAARAAAADLDGRAAGRGWMPEITVGIGNKRSDDGLVSTSSTLLSLSVPLPVFDRQQAGEGRASAQALTARAEYRLARSRSEGQLRGWHAQASQLIAAAGRYRREAVAPSAELVRIAEAAYRAGESSVLELLDAYRGALDAENTALDLEWKAREARIELDQLTGTTTP